MEVKMKFQGFLALTCIVIFVCAFSIGCEQAIGPLMFAIDDSLIPDDVDKNLPEISPISNFEQTRYRMRVARAVSADSKLIELRSFIGDHGERVTVKLYLNPAPLSKAADGMSITGYKVINDAIILDVVVVKITKVINETTTLLEYEGIIEKNLSRPEVEIVYPDEDA